MIMFRLVICVMLLGTMPLMAQKSDVKVNTIVLHAQNSSLGGNMVDLDKHQVYTLEEAGYNPKRIDLGFMYGKNTGGNIMAPVSQGFLTFGDKIKEMFLLWGNDRNNGTIINLGNSAAANEIFDAINSSEDIMEGHEHWFDEIMDVEDYDPGKHGPGQRTKPISIGDVIFFKSENKKKYHILRIRSYLPSYNGKVEIEVKSSKK